MQKFIVMTNLRQNFGSLKMTGLFIFFFHNAQKQKNGTYENDKNVDRNTFKVEFYVNIYKVATF
jgi:hypothetical protein